MVGKPEPAAHRGNDDTRPLRLRLFQQHPAEQLPVSGIEVADRLVEQDEIERLAHAADEGHALLLSEGELIDRGIPLIGDTRSLEHSPDLLLRLEMRELVFQADILRDGQFAEKTQILEKHTQRPAAQAAPRRGGKAAAIRPVEEYPPRVILPDAVEKVAQRSFPRSRSSLEQAVLPPCGRSPPATRPPNLAEPLSPRTRRAAPVAKLSIPYLLYFKVNGRSNPGRPFTINPEGYYKLTSGTYRRISSPILSQTVLKEFCSLSVILTTAVPPFIVP